jgi:hypothetical protein
MHDDLCEGCGSAATVTIGVVRSNRAGEHAQPAVAHRYCRDCARAAGVPLPPRKPDARRVTEPELPSWQDVEQHLAQYEQILQEQPTMREQVLLLARHLWDFADKMPGEMPSAVVRAFARIGARAPE